MNKRRNQLRNLPTTDSRRATDLHGGTGDSWSGQGKQEGTADDRTRTGGTALTPLTTCIEHAYGSTVRLSFQIKVF